MKLLDDFSAEHAIAALLGAQSGVLLGLSANFERLLGYRPEEAIGKAPVEIGLWADLEDRGRMWSQLREHGHIVALPCKVRHAQGHVLNALISAELIKRGDELQLFCLLQFLGEGAGSSPLSDDDSLFRSMYQHAAEGMYRALPEGGFTHLNPAQVRLLGYEDAESVLRDWGRNADGLYVDQVLNAELNRRLIAEGRVEGWRSQIRRADGEVIWVNENARCIYNDKGDALFFEGTMVDITAEMQAEQALKQSEALYRVVVDHSSDGVFLTQDGLILFANRAVSDMLEYPEQELIGKSYFDLVHPDDLQSQKDRLAARLHGDDSFQHYELAMITRTGRKLQCEVRADGVMYRGRMASTGTIRDIGAERERLRALAEAEQRYRELFESSPVGLFRTHMDGSILEINLPMARMMGYDSVSDLRAHVTHMTQIYANPAQRQELVERAIRDGVFQNVELLVNSKSGETKLVSASVNVVRDAEGRPYTFTGSAQDLSDRLRMELALQSSEAKYRELVENSQVGVFQLDDAGRFTYVNRFFCETLGYPEAVLLGRGYAEFLDEHEVGRSGGAEKLIAKHIAEHAAFETSMRHQSGQRLFVRVHFSDIGVDGHVTGTALNITQQRQAEERLRHLATHDPLTGLPNRLMFNRRLAELMANTHHDRRKSPYAVLFLDMDGFKWVNDSLGHGAGDRLLVEISRRLENELVHEALIARYGGDEFTVLPDGPADYERAAEIARRILRCFERPFDLGGQEVFSGTSVGIVLARDEYVSPDQVLRDADTAMYQAKAAGKSQFVIFDEAMHARARDRFELETQFRVALERGEFRLFYQPIVELISGRVVGAEALVRWQHPKRGLMSPGEFYEIGEDTGLITTLDQWVLAMACRQLAEWRERHPAEMADFWLNVNTDERRLAGAEMVEQVFALLQQYQLPASLLNIEVTEKAFERGRAHAQEQLESLKALGIGLVVDDFGTGYSSLEAFASSPFDSLKVDQIFVRDIDSNPRHAAIVRTIVGFANDLRLKLTAEGIETDSQRRTLMSMGCQLGQGYLFHRPMPAEEFAQRLLPSATLPSR